MYMGTCIWVHSLEIQVSHALDDPPAGVLLYVPGRPQDEARQAHAARSGLGADGEQIQCGGRNFEGGEGQCGSTPKV
jgi:hypothetical protein